MLAIEIVSCLELKVFVCLFVCYRVSLCSFGYPGTSPLNQADLKLKEIHLTLPPKSWNLRCVPPSLS